MRGTTDSSESAKTQKVEFHVWGRVRAGFVMFVPILVTYLVLRFLVGYTDGLLAPLLGLLPFTFPGLSLLLLFVIFYFTGLIVSPKMGKMAVSAQHAVFSRIPVVKNIYGLTEQVAEHLSAYSEHEFSRVVLVEWPKPDVFAIGFVTGSCDMRGEPGERLAIYIPTVPNPTSGMFAIVRQRDVIDTDITVEEALKLVLSGGIVLPAKMEEIRVDQRLQADAKDAKTEPEPLTPYLNGSNGRYSYGRRDRSSYSGRSSRYKYNMYGGRTGRNGYSSYYSRLRSLSES